MKPFTQLPAVCPFEGNGIFFISIEIKFDGFTIFVFEKQNRNIQLIFKMALTGFLTLELFNQCAVVHDVVRCVGNKIFIFWMSSLLTLELFDFCIDCIHDEGRGLVV